MNIIVNTYRRSGTVFLSTLIADTLEASVEARHDHYLGDLPTITIVREPKGCIASSVILDHQDPFYIKTLDEMVKEEVIKYNNFMDHIAENIDVVFDFNDLDKVSLILDHISKTFDLPYRGKHLSNDGEYESKYHLFTSKEHPEYTKVIEILDQTDLSQSYSKYREVLKLAHRI
jgi:hypothetical protein